MNEARSEGTTSKHTPGPWIADGPVVEAFDAPFTADICCTLREGYGWQTSLVPDMATAFANACLIAAAPDLLAALEAVEDAMPGAFGIVSAAIARARGEAGAS